MIRSIISIGFYLTTIFFASAQKKDSIPNLSKGDYVLANLQDDTISPKDKASQTLRRLRNGAIIVRFKTNERNVAAYRKAGRNDIAEKIIESRKVQNEKMYSAFEHAFKFCRVYFIYANKTMDFLNGNHKVFLNSRLEVDTSIVFNDTAFVFCEYGSVESFSNFNDYAHPVQGTGSDINGKVRSGNFSDTIPIQTSTSPTTTSGLFFSDKNLKQFHRPFPYAEGVYMDNFTPVVAFLSARLFKEYGQLVKKTDFMKKVKEKRKQEKAIKKKKEKPKYNPFK